MKKEELKRWRLILGKESENKFEQMSGESIGLSHEQDMMDRALAAIYNDTSSGGFGSRGSGRGPSNIKISNWLGDIRSLFDSELVTVIQNDAVNRCGLKQLLFEPELLDNLEPDVGLCATIMNLKEMIPNESKENVRAFVRKIVDDINKRLEQDVKRAVTQAVNKKMHCPIPSAAAMDMKMTIEKNMKNYNPELKTIVPEHFYFFDRMTNTAAKKWNIILDIDQSGSMGESIIYSSILSCILASMSSVKTRIVAFDTKVIDLTDKCEDPVDLLFGFQMGGGTDINKSIAYCEQFIENPAKTLFFLISDLEEYGNMSGMVRRLKQMKELGVTVCCMLAIQDGGEPYYNKHVAQKIAQYDIPVFACVPEKLPQILEKAIKGQKIV